MNNTSAENATLQPFKEYPNCGLFNFVVWGVIVGILCIFGFFGNTLSVIAFQRDRRVSATTLIQCLACSDFLLLLTVFITDSIPYICGYTEACPNWWYTWPYIRYIWIFTPMAHMSSIWFVQLIALNRFWAVVRPHDMNRVWNVKRAWYYVIMVVGIVIAFNTPRFFEYRMAYGQDMDTNMTKVEEVKTWLGQQSSYKVGYKVMLVNIVLVILPLIMLIGLTAAILHKLRMRARTAVDSKSMASKGQQEITFMLVIVVVVAIICQTPLAVFHFVRYVFTYWCGDWVYYLDNISKSLINVNASVNFVVYTLFSNKFRRLLLNVLLCQDKTALGRAEGYSGRASTREVNLSNIASKKKKNADGKEYEMTKQVDDDEEDQNNTHTSREPINHC